MRQHASKLVLGATLFSTPGMRTDHYWPGLLGVVMVLLVVVPPVVLFVRGSRPSPPNSDGDDGGGGGLDPPSGPRPKPQGGIPLDDAVPTRVRLRGPGRLADHRATRVRRPAREPDRVPTRS